MQRTPFLFTASVLLCLAFLFATPSAYAGATLDAIRAAGSLPCGVNFEEAEYSIADAHGNHSLFDIDLCKAMAVAVLGPGAKFTVVPFRAEKDALAGLKAGKIAVLATASVNLINSVDPGIALAHPVLYDDQGLLVNKAAGIHSAHDLAGKKICFLGDTEIQAQLQGYMAREKIAWLPFPFSEEGEMEAALITGNCAAVSADVTQLAYERIAFKGMATSFVILPDRIAKDPLAPASRTGDPGWTAIVNWVVQGMIQAEESGVTRADLATMKKSQDPEVMRLLGTQKGYGQYLKLEDAWVANVVEAVGNYGELFERDLGAGSVMRLDRGENNLWTQGGLMYADPIR